MHKNASDLIRLAVDKKVKSGEISKKDYNDLNYLAYFLILFILFLTVALIICLGEGAANESTPVYVHSETSSN